MNHPQLQRIEELTEELCELLKGARRSFEEWENSDINEIIADTDRRIRDGPYACLAREICDKLLTISSSDGMGGCPLCAS